MRRPRSSRLAVDFEFRQDPHRDPATPASQGQEYRVFILLLSYYILLLSYYLLWCPVERCGTLRRRLWNDALPSHLDLQPLLCIMAICASVSPNCPQVGNCTLETFAWSTIQSAEIYGTFHHNVPGHLCTLAMCDQRRDWLDSSKLLPADSTQV